MTEGRVAPPPWSLVTWSVYLLGWSGVCTPTHFTGDWAHQSAPRPSLLLPSFPLRHGRAPLASLVSFSLFLLVSHLSLVSLLGVLFLPVCLSPLPRLPHLLHFLPLVSYAFLPHILVSHLTPKPRCQAHYNLSQNLSISSLKITRFVFGHCSVHVFAIPSTCVMEWRRNVASHFATLSGRVF